MKLVAERFVSIEEQNLLKMIQVTMDHLPDVVLYDYRGWRAPISCHMLSRVFADVFKIEYRDGYYVHKMHPHSWLILKSGNIIDCYPYWR